MPEDKLRGSLDAVKSNIAKAVDRMPSHQEWLQRYAATAPVPPARAAVS
jgi:tryptophan halogenase